MFARGIQIEAGREVPVLRHFPRISKITRSFCRCDTAFSYAEEVLINFLFFSEILFFNVIEIICYAPYFKGLVRDIFNPNFGKT